MSTFTLGTLSIFSCYYFCITLILFCNKLSRKSEEMCVDYFFAVIPPLESLFILLKWSHIWKENAFVGHACEKLAKQLIRLSTVWCDCIG